ncbi:MAG: hypothetical protein ACWGMZ_04995 [Thermoguttaceae bacterium]
MEATSLPTTNLNDWTEQFSAALESQRRRAREFFSAQEEKLRRAEDILASQLGEIGDDLLKEREDIRHTREELTDSTKRLEHQTAELERMKKEIAEQQAAWNELYSRALEEEQSLSTQFKQQQEELAASRKDIVEQQAAAINAEIKLESERKTFEAERGELEQQKKQFQVQQDDLRREQENLEKFGREIEEKAEKTEQQRRRIAAELKTRRAEQLQELQQRRSELQRADEADQDALLKELERLREECQLLRTNPPAAVQTAEEGEKADAEKYRLLYETAEDELNRLKTYCEELQENLAEAQQKRTKSGAGTTSSALDWETEKKRVLAALESDYDDDDQQDQEEKLKIEEVVRKTNRIIAEKERENSELQELLSSQTKHIGSVAVGAASVGKIVDNDAIIQQERKSLKELQDECREKLRKAEVEISLERAKIARERAQLDEKIRQLEQHGLKSGESSEDKEPVKPVGGRWRARLGLNESSDKQEK